MSNIEVRDWAMMKSFVDTYNVPIDWIERNDAYLLTSHDRKNTGNKVSLLLPKISSDVSDFENNYKGTLVESVASANVSGSSSAAKSTTPASGKKIIIQNFCAEGLYGNDVICQLIWDYDSGNDEVIWSIRGSGSIPFYHVIPSSDTDGVKKLAAVVTNNTLTQVHASIFTRFYRI